MSESRDTSYVITDEKHGETFLAAAIHKVKFGFNDRINVRYETLEGEEKYTIADYVESIERATAEIKPEAER